MTTKSLFKHGEKIGYIYDTDDHYIYAKVKGENKKIWRFDVNYIDGAYHLNCSSVL